MKPVPSITEEFEETLAQFHRECAGDPRAELVRLFLIGLEREQIVTVGYREELLATRLQTLPISSEERALLRHALLWVWKDEQMHAIYLRGALLRLGGRLLRIQSYLGQVQGWIGGWSSSVVQHVHWREAPLSRALAGLLNGVGTLAGKVPRAVRKQLEYTSFREYCRGNLETEKTAARAFERMAQLAQSIPGLPPSAHQEFLRMQADELRHAQLFDALVSLLDENDHFSDGGASLEAHIREIGEPFLPRARRAVTQALHPIGSGGVVHVHQGASAEEKLPLFTRLLGETQLSQVLAARAKATGKSVAELQIVIKPTFMMAYHRRDASPVVDPELVDALARWLAAQGARDVVVAEAPNIYDRWFRNRSVREVAAYAGFTSQSYRIVDTSEDQVSHTFNLGMAQHSISRTWRDADARIVFGKLRSHPSEVVHLTLGALEGLGERHDAYLFEERQAHRQSALMMMLAEFPPHFAVLEGYDSAADGLNGVMGAPRAPVPHRLYAGVDALSVDVVAGRHVGLRDPRRSELLRSAIHWFGHPAPEVQGPDTPIPGWRSPQDGDLNTLLSLVAYPVYEFGSARGSYFVPQMDAAAFPPSTRVGLPLRMVRGLIQRLFGQRLS
mgnify:CR=1 FL=1